MTTHKPTKPMGKRCRLRTAICLVSSRRCSYPGLRAHNPPTIPITQRSRRTYNCGVKQPPHCQMTARRRGPSNTDGVTDAVTVPHAADHGVADSVTIPNTADHGVTDAVTVPNTADHGVTDANMHRRNPLPHAADHGVTNAVTVPNTADNGVTDAVTVPHSAEHGVSDAVTEPYTPDHGVTDAVIVQRSRGS
ncbi:hypothetical protein FSP39_012940 [Pinctada imbricata]|uniref:Uncharacterized protein n=1 Tax=Pinctada imbricata TaxID=66713 RepID=A0AA89C3D4_PINIB|nr:hypothetical protein FSP39_012940 [Pinctada imbricata]